MVLSKSIQMGSMYPLVIEEENKIQEQVHNQILVIVIQMLMLRLEELLISKILMSVLFLFLNKLNISNRESSYWLSSRRRS
jgi:hypothetical protein